MSAPAPAWIEPPGVLAGRATRSIGPGLHLVAELSPEAAAVCRRIERADGRGAAKAYLWSLFDKLAWRAPTDDERAKWAAARKASR